MLLLGLGVQAASTYAFLIIAGRVLGAAGFGALSGLYVLLTSVATGLFQPLEQELTRRRGVETATRTHDSTLHRRAVTLGLVTATVAAAVALAGWPVSVRLVGQQPALVVSLCVALPGYAVWFSARGELAGRRELAWYAAQLTVDGMFRLIAAVALTLLGQDGLTWFGILFALSPWLAAATGTLGRRRTGPAGAEEVATPGVTRPVLLLVASALATQLIVNAGPLIVTLLATSADRAQVGVFLAVLVVLRVPIFLFTAVQPPLLTALSGLAATDRRASFTSLLRRVLLAVLAVAVLATVLGTLVVPRVVTTVFAFDDVLSRRTYFVLTASVGLLMLGLVLAQALLALAQHRAIMLGWLCGFVGLAVGAEAGHSVVTSGAYGLGLGACTALVGLAALLGAVLHRWRVASLVPGVLAVGAAPPAEP